MNLQDVSTEAVEQAVTWGHVLSDVVFPLLVAAIAGLVGYQLARRRGGGG